eukprot:1848536-Amphidinium_carterae.1
MGRTTLKECSSVATCFCEDLATKRANRDKAERPTPQGRTQLSPLEWVFKGHLTFSPYEKESDTVQRKMGEEVTKRACRPKLVLRCQNKRKHQNIGSLKAKTSERKPTALHRLMFGWWCIFRLSGCQCPRTTCALVVYSLFARSSVVVSFPFQKKQNLESVNLRLSPCPKRVYQTIRNK